MGAFSTISVSIELALDGTSSPMIGSTDPGFTWCVEEHCDLTR